MNRKTILLASACLAFGITSGILIQQYLATDHRATPTRTKEATAPVILVTSNTVMTEITKILSELPGTSGDSLGPVTLAKFSQLTRHLASNAFPYAARAALSQPEKTANQMLAAMVPSWIKKDREGARLFAFELAGSQRTKYLNTLMTAWSHESPDSLAAWVLESKDEQITAVGYPMLATRLVRLDPTNAYPLWLKFPADQQRHHGWIMFSQWSRKDPAEAVKTMAKHVATNPWLSGTMKSAIQQWAEKDVTGAIAYLMAMPDGEQRRELIESCASAFGRTDPKSALQLVQALPVGSSRQMLLGRIVGSWAEANALEAFKWARNLPEGSERKTALESTLVRMAETAPSELQRFIQTEPAHPSVVENAPILTKRLAGTNATMLLEWANRLSPGRTRDTMLFQGISGLDSVPPPQAISLAQEHLSGAARQTAINGIFRRWAQRDPVQASKAAMELPLGAELTGALAAVAERWSVSDTEAATKWLLSLPANAERQPAEKELVRALESSKPERAGEFIMKLSDSDHSAQLLEAVMDRWAKLDLKTAVAWLEKQTTDSRSARAYGKLAYACLQSDLLLAANLAEKAPSNEGQYSVRKQVATEWAKTDPEAATKWVMKLGTNDSSLRQYFSQVFQAWARIAPHAALQYLGQLPASSPASPHSTTRYECIQTALIFWADKEPPAVLKWINTNTSGTRLDDSRRWLLSHWAKSNPEELVHWLYQQPNDETRNSAASHALPFVAALQPDLATRSIELIAGIDQRRSVMESIYRSWHRRDESSARSWLKTNDLPAATKERLLKDSN